MFKRLSELFYGKQHPEAQRPAPTAIPSPLKPHPEPALLTRNWSHPFGDRADPLQQLTHLARAGNGFYPLGVHGSWHAGVHFDGATAGVLDQSRVLCMADGEVVAYRIPGKTPTTRYGTVPRPEFDAPFASGFVLVRHRIQAPALDNSDETPPALTFYSLYMHLEDWVAYDGTALQRPGFWAESEKKWVRDDAPDSRPGIGRGVNVKALRTSSATLDFLAAGTEVVISGEGELRQLDSPGPTWLQNADGTLQGYISVSGLGVRSGDLLMIKTRSLNVHAEPGLQGAVLGKLPEDTFVRVSGEGDFLKLDRVVQYVPIKALRSEWVPAQRNAVFIPDKPIPIQAGDLIGHIGIYQSAIGDPRRQLHLEVFCVDYFPGFLNDSRAWAERLPAKEKTWLKLAKGTAVVFHQDHFGPKAHPTTVHPHYLSDTDLLVPKSLLDNLPADRKIHRKATDTAIACTWYRVEGLFRDAEDHWIDGWVKDMQGETTWISPWEWDGYEVIETSGSQALGMAYRMYRAADTSEADRTRDRHMCADEIRHALNTPALAQALSKIVLRSESEWYYRKEKWDALDTVFGHTTSAPLHNWLAEKQRIEALSWWGEVMGPLGFPKGVGAWFLHPLGLTGSFLIDDNDLRWLTVPHGQLTFDVEGNDIESSAYFSRVAHWPGGASGITIGRGYDLGQRPDPESDMKKIGIEEPLLSWLIGAKGLKGVRAKSYMDSASPAIKNQKITRKQQYELFVPIYEHMKNSVIRISQENKRFYGELNWEMTDKKIQDVIIDLIYRGDYNTQTRPFIQRPFTTNDMGQFIQEISNPDRWPTVPRDRFQRRRGYVQQ